MKRRANATLIGAFVVAGLALLLAGVIVAGGDKLFARKERVVMYFSGSIYGLQVGAPVVFRGVRVGSISAIGLVYDAAKDEFVIPVEADLEPRAIRGLASSDARGARRSVVTDMVARGLRAQLSMQSLLTGQLYVDLDLRPQKPALLRGSADSGTLEIPTTATAIQALKNQIDGLDFRRLLDDLSAIAESARNVISGPQLKKAMDDMAAITGHVRRFTDRIDARFDPLANETAATLTETREAVRRLGAAADEVNQTAQRVGRTSDQVGALVAPESPLVLKLQQTADELAQTAASLRRQTGEDTGLLQNADRALKDVSRAARAVRELADLLDQHPESLIRGRPADPLQQEKPR